MPQYRSRTSTAGRNMAMDGCVVKTAGVDEDIYVFESPARVLVRLGRSRALRTDDFRAALQVF